MVTKLDHKRRMANFIGANDGDVPAVAANTVAAAITGDAEIGETLSVSNGTWTGEPAPSGYGYQWRADGVDIPGANADEFLVGDEQHDQVLTCEVRAWQPNGYVPFLTAATTAIIGSVPANTTPPSITGTAQVGETLSADPGEWTGRPIPTFAYQWLADAVEIEGAEAATYELTVAEEGAVITVTVTATNVEGSDSETSAATSEVAAAE